jgi:hypothetical protein
MSSGLVIFPVVPLAGGAGILADITTLIFPPEQAPCRPPNVQLTLTHSFLIHHTIQKDADMVFPVDIPYGYLMVTFTNETPLDPYQLTVPAHDFLLLSLYGYYTGILPNVKRFHAWIIGLNDEIHAWINPVWIFIHHPTTRINSTFYTVGKLPLSPFL